ncbi:MAG: hypothetical protein ACI86C_001217 [Candidatus Latescibacterota bacterium]|jgi:hypothetical protein
MHRLGRAFFILDRFLYGHTLPNTERKINISGVDVVPSKFISPIHVPLQPKLPKSISKSSTSTIPFKSKSPVQGKQEVYSHDPSSHAAVES